MNHGLVSGKWLVLIFIVIPGFALLKLLNDSKEVASSHVSDYEKNDTSNRDASIAARASQEVLRDIHIVFIGDTVMHYQYLSLVYRLRYGVWFDDSLWSYNLVNEQSFESPFHERTRAEFLFQTTEILQPMEICDCFSRQDEAKDLENRYFYDPIRNNSIVYLSALGHKRTLRGRLLPHEIRNQSSSWHMDSMHKPKPRRSWEYDDWSDAILKYVRFLDPPPQHVVMSPGIREHRFGRSQPSTTTVHDNNNPWTPDTLNLLHAVHNASEIQFVWMTSTFGVAGKRAQLGRNDEHMCTLLPMCLNVSFTQHIRADLYWDQWHFREPVYRVVNEQLLNLLGYLPTDYVMMNISELLPVSTSQLPARQSLGNNALAKDMKMSSTARIKSDPSTELRDIHIVMIGDSLMRYQYLSLAYRLRYGVWFNESLWRYNLADYHTFLNPLNGHLWSEFLLQTNRLLRPLELCDCYREPRPNDIYENRYYYDPVLNNSVVFLTAFGHGKRPMKGRILPSQIHQERANRSSWFKQGAFAERTEPVWSYYDWSETILHYIRYLHPKPKYVVVNAGIWAHKFCSSNHSSSVKYVASLSNETQHLIAAMQTASEFQFVWRTTTWGRDGVRPEFECDDIMCDLLPLCVNASFTKHVVPHKYWDPLHFYEPVYRAVNEEMIHDMGYLPKAYIRFDRSEFMT